MKEKHLFSFGGLIMCSIFALIMISSNNDKTLSSNQQEITITSTSCEVTADNTKHRPIEEDGPIN